MLRLRTAAVLLAGPVLACAACGSTGGGAAGDGGNRLAGLSAAIDAANRTRAATSTALAKADAAIGLADAVDADALAGMREAAAPLVAKAGAEVTAAAADSGPTAADAGAYAAALGRLQTAQASAPLSKTQHQAVGAVVTAGRAEAAAFETAAAAYGAAFPTYADVVSLQETWYAHADAGWFDTPQESGGAYQVAREADLAALTTAQQRLAAADAGRRAATPPMDAALTAARTALASLT